MQDILNSDITYLKGVGPQKALVLASELGIKTYVDLLHHFPYRYIDRSKFYTIDQLEEDMNIIQIKGKISSMEIVGEGRRKRLVANFTDGTGITQLVWFKGVKWIKEKFKIGKTYIVFGKPTLFNRSFSFTHPEIEEEKNKTEALKVNLQPYYNTTEKMKAKYINSKAIHQYVLSILPKIKGKLTETLPAHIIQQEGLMYINEAIYNIHIPESEDHLHRARYRLKFEELFYIQLKILRLKHNRNATLNGFLFTKVGTYFNSFYENCLPFELTGAQKKVLREIRQDTATGKQMNRLLQGDVGSGKTLVALMTALLALDNGFQACLMAPTEILANQHYSGIKELLTPLDINISILTGSTKAKQRRSIHEQLLNGELQLLIGTHALIEDTVQFKNLGMVIIDEQHRFGVAQRARLWKKNKQPPHVLVMTATPIPRTLAMTLYGDLDVSVIDELPPGRIPIKTVHYFDNKRLRVFGFMREQIKKGQQVYVVFPLIKESAAMDYKDLEDGLESISRAFPSPQYGISVVHGKMKAEEKDKAMDLFVRKQTQIMVATTVIEVGVNVPNATTMIIESAERFGLSQLHQLRGRVGRGSEASYCILMTGNKLSSDGRKRMQTMVNSTDGFEISEVDLKLRGPGDIEGTQQSGIPIDLKIANLGKDNEILKTARQVAEKILTADEKLEKQENAILNKYLSKKYKQELNWSRIS